VPRGDGVLSSGTICWYHRNTGAIQSIESDWPPFLREVPKTLRLIWKGSAVPDSALVAREPIGELSLDVPSTTPNGTAEVTPIASTSCGGKGGRAGCFA
jgi:hypothetical protein